MIKKEADCQGIFIHGIMKIRQMKGRQLFFLGSNCTFLNLSTETVQSSKFTLKYGEGSACCASSQSCLLYMNLYLDRARGSTRLNSPSDLMWHCTVSTLALWYVTVVSLINQVWLGQEISLLMTSLSPGVSTLVSLRILQHNGTSLVLQTLDHKGRRITNYSIIIHAAGTMVMCSQI